MMYQCSLQDNAKTIMCKYRDGHHCFDKTKNCDCLVRYVRADVAIRLAKYMYKKGFSDGNSYAFPNEEAQQAAQRGKQ